MVYFLQSTCFGFAIHQSVSTVQQMNMWALGNFAKCYHKQVLKYVSFLLLFGQSLSDKIGCMIFAMFVFIKYSTAYSLLACLITLLVLEIDIKRACSTWPQLVQWMGISAFPMRQTAEIFSICFFFDFVKPLKI